MKIYRNKVITPEHVTRLQNRPKQELQITAQDFKMITACFLTSDKDADQNQASRHQDANLMVLATFPPAAKQSGRFSFPPGDLLQVPTCLTFD